MVSKKQRGYNLPEIVAEHSRRISELERRTMPWIETDTGTTLVLGGFITVLVVGMGHSIHYLYKGILWILSVS